MRLLVLLLMSFALIKANKDECEKSQPPTLQEDCENLTSEYEKYRECMEHRSKRSICQSNDECGDCDCDSCEASCEDDDCSNSCCNSCCQVERPTCTTYRCCHRTCRAECRSSSCRSSCRRRCQSETKQPILQGPSSGALSSNINQTLKSDHNITTIIHLNNIINNTNLINLPVNVNNTNVNNITVETANSPSAPAPQRIIVEQIPSLPGPPGPPGIPGASGIPGTSGTSGENCCLTVGPKQCVQQKEFPYTKCFHVRKRACGAMCTAPVVHYQKHKVCDNDVDAKDPCKEQIVYIPQQQPRCTYQETWPYISCEQQSSCEGCYFNREEGANCGPHCYDNGYNMNPYFQPYYRPVFPPLPPMPDPYVGYSVSSDPINYAIESGDSNQPPVQIPNDPYIQGSVQFKNLQNAKDQAEIKIVPLKNKRGTEEESVSPTVTST